MQSVRESLAGRYELVDVVGRGGMGVVYRGRDRVLDRQVAVKALPDERAGDPALVARFEREARAAGALNHPNIVAVFDTGHEAGTHFIVMEYVTGLSLAQVVREQGRLAPERVVRIGVQIAGALAAAHGAGIIHRDIKPANVMVDDAARVKVLDFGIARAAGATSLTQADVVLGSAPYLAPEVARGESADERSDIYSLGCLLYELLTGRPPFTAEVPAAVLHQHNTVRPRPPRERNPEVPPGLDALVLEMLAKRPEDRPRSAEQLAVALAASLEGPRAPHPASGLSGGPFAEAPTAPTQVLGPMRRSRRGQRFAVAGLVVALAVAGLLFVLLGSSGRHPGRAGVTGAGNRTATVSARTASTAAKTSTASREAAPTSPSTNAASRSTPPATTVPAAAGALTTLITQGLQSGAIDQHGQDLLNHLQDILASYEQQHAADALHKVDDLVTRVGDLADHGDIQPSAVPAITAAIVSLRAAIQRSAQGAPETPGPAGPAPPAPHHPPHGPKGPKPH